MKYALLIYADPAGFERLSAEEREAVTNEYMAIGEDERVSGGVRLQSADTATTVRVNGSGEALLTDGPFVDSKEVLGGLFLVEAENLDEATALAARVPASRHGGGVEVRPLFVEQG